MDNHKLFLQAIESLAETRRLFQLLADDKIILGNDNHIGDIGEYWVQYYFEKGGFQVIPAKTKVDPVDLTVPAKSMRISVKTVTEWSKRGKGTQVKPLNRENNPWNTLAAVRLGKNLKPKMIAIISLSELMKQDVFIENEHNRMKNGTKSYPQFQWWDWLDSYTIDLLNTE